MSRPFDLRVECYAGYKADERPVRFYLAGNRYEVIEVEDRWFGPDSVFFRVRASDGNLYILRHIESGQQDTWLLESYRGSRTGALPPDDPSGSSPA